MLRTYDKLRQPSYGIVYSNLPVAPQIRLKSETNIHRSVLSYTLGYLIFILLVVALKS